MSVICGGWRLFAGGYVIYPLLEAGWLLSAGCVYSIIYLRQVDGCLQWGWNTSVICGSLAVFCIRCVNCVIHLRNVGGCLHGMCELCHIQEAGWMLSPGVRVLRRSLDKDWRLSTAGVLYQLHKAGRRFFAKEGVICQSLEACWRLFAVGCVNSVSSDTYTE